MILNLKDIEDHDNDNPLLALASGDFSTDDADIRNVLSAYKAKRSDMKTSIPKSKKATRYHYP